MKAKKIITIVITVIAGLMVTFSGIMKLIKPRDVVDKLTAAGVGNYITLLGTMEIVFTALFIYPRTMKPGLILLSCYFAGAMATELSHDGPFLNPVLPLALVWVSAFLRDRTAFLPAKENS